MRIEHAALHVLDFVSCENTFSEIEMDLTDKVNKGYVSKHARKALSDINGKRGEFSPESAFAVQLDDYLSGRDSFIELSRRIAEFVAGELQHMEKPESTDVLVVDFEDDTDESVRAMTDEEAEAAYKAQANRYFAIVLLESKQAYMHDTLFSDEGQLRNGIIRQRSILPNPSQKVASYALVDVRKKTVEFCDKPRVISGEERFLISDGLLQCSTMASPKETFEGITRIVEEVAEEYGANAAVALSKAKAYVSEAVDEVDRMHPEDLGSAVFEEDSPMRQRFEEALVEQQIPESVPVERAVVSRVAKNHKIRTDTGIEITFPVEYGSNTDYMEFVSGPDGRISIELKNIGHIENR